MNFAETIAGEVEAILPDVIALRRAIHAEPEPDYEFFDGVKAIEGEGWPLMHFVEHRLAGDPTNWWVPNSAA